MKRYKLTDKQIEILKRSEFTENRIYLKKENDNLSVSFPLDIEEVEEE